MRTFEKWCEYFSVEEGEPAAFSIVDLMKDWQEERTKYLQPSNVDKPVVNDVAARDPEFKELLFEYESLAIFLFKLDLDKIVPKKYCLDSELEKATEVIKMFKF